MERRTLENIFKFVSLLGGIGSKISSDVQQQTDSVAASLLQRVERTARGLGSRITSIDKQFAALQIE